MRHAGLMTPRTESKDHYVKPILYDVQFGDGARFCVESEQILFVED